MTTFANDLAASTLCSNLDTLVNLSVDDMAKLYRDVLTALTVHLSRFVAEPGRITHSHWKSVDNDDDDPVPPV